MLHNFVFLLAFDWIKTVQQVPRLVLLVQALSKRITSLEQHIQQLEQKGEKEDNKPSETAALLPPFSLTRRTWRSRQMELERQHKLNSDKEFNAQVQAEVQKRIEYWTGKGKGA